MKATDLVLRLISIFDQVGVQYMLVGSYSSNLYGRERATNDADFVLVIEQAQLQEVAKKLGDEFQVDSQMSFETITLTTRYILTFVPTAFKIELFLLSDDPHDRARFSRRTKVDFEGYPTSLPTPEDVVITKLRWSKGGKRSKDISDVATVLAVQFGKLDLAYIRQWCDQHGTRDLFEQVFREAAAMNRPPDQN